MLTVIDASMVDSLESKLNVILKAIETLSMRTNNIQDFVIRFHNNHKARTSQPMSSITLQVFLSTKPTTFLVQEESPSIEHLDTSKFKELKVSLLKKFDGTRLKF